jgi:5-methylcytosine-specific restriction endonuclease McrA
LFVEPHIHSMDFYRTYRWHLLRRLMFWLYDHRCMRCGSTERLEVDHIIARARGPFGHSWQWNPRNLQILCHDCNQAKMTDYDDRRPLWARMLLPLHDTPSHRR